MPVSVVPGAPQPKEAGLPRIKRVRRPSRRRPEIPVTTWKTANQSAIAAEACTRSICKSLRHLLTSKQCSFPGTGACVLARTLTLLGDVDKELQELSSLSASSAGAARAREGRCPLLESCRPAPQP